MSSRRSSAERGNTGQPVTRSVTLLDALSPARSRRCSAQAYPCRQCHEPLCFGPVIIDWRYGKEEPAPSQADLLDQNRVPGIGEHDYVPGIDVTGQDYGLHR